MSSSKQSQSNQQKSSTSKGKNQKDNAPEPEKKEDKDAMFSDLTDEELLELFTVVDADGGGTISRDELKDVMVCC